MIRRGPDLQQVGGSRVSRTLTSGNGFYQTLLADFSQMTYRRRPISEDDLPGPDYFWLVTN